MFEKNNGEIFDSPNTQKFIAYSINFLDKLAINLGLPHLRDYEQFKKIPITKTHFSSMYRDIQEGRTPETKAIIEAPLEVAEYFQPQTSTSFVTQPLETLKALLNAKSNHEFIPPDHIQDLFNQTNLWGVDSIEAHLIEQNNNEWQAA